MKVIDTDRYYVMTLFYICCHVLSSLHSFPIPLAYISDAPISYAPFSLPVSPYLPLTCVSLCIRLHNPMFLYVFNLYVRPDLYLSRILCIFGLFINYRLSVMRFVSHSRLLIVSSLKLLRTYASPSVSSIRLSAPHFL